MPVLHRRADGSGHYIKGRLDGGFVTLQLIEPARQLLLEDFGYRDGDTVPWQVLTPLCMLNHAYTKSGGGPGGDASGGDFSDAVQSLSSTQRKRLRTYLDTYDDFTPRQRRWIDPHVRSGSAERSRERDRGNDPGSSGGTSYRSLSVNEYSKSTVTADGEVRASSVTAGDVLEAPVDRIEADGDVIVEMTGTAHLNLGAIAAVSPGEPVQFRITSAAFGEAPDAVHLPHSNVVVRGWAWLRRKLGAAI